MNITSIQKFQIYVSLNLFKLVTAAWKPLEADLKSGGHKLVGVESNLVDQIWDDQPAVPCNPVIVLPERYTGNCRQTSIMKSVSSKFCVFF